MYISYVSIIYFISLKSPINTAHKTVGEKHAAIE